jgi:hypothetical protein
MAVAGASSWVNNFHAQCQNTSAKMSGIDNLTNWLDSEVTGKLELAAPIGGSSKFTWEKSVFKAKIMSIGPSSQQSIGADILSSAWAAATTASDMLLMGGYVGAPAPPTKWAGPPSATVILGTAQQDLYNDLLSLSPEKDQSKLPIAFRKAFLAIKYMLSGSNMDPDGPKPLIVPQAVVK